jgi:hypothetical protein
MNDYFCVLPFFGYEVGPGNASHCCLLPPDYNIDDIRNSILAGKRSDYCKACWNLENAGLVSDRHLKNQALDFYKNQDIKFIEQDVHKGNYKTSMVKIVTSNTCNSTCVTCNSGASSAWAPLEKKLKKIPIQPWSISSSRMDQVLLYKDLVTLNFVGGEPLVEKLNFYALEKLLEHGNDQCFISFTTNGSVKLTVHQQDLLKKFKNFHIGISIDGVGPVFEYLRYPLKWDKLLDNLDFFRTLTDNISANYTISNLNVLYHHETIAWFNKQKLRYHYNIVINPSYFGPTALSKKIKDKIFSTNGPTQDLIFLIGQDHTTHDDINFEEMLTVIKDQDFVKGISYQDYLPELELLSCQ